ncbi:MAG: DUF393 domain-containing protein [Gammaproteobacteria bacterium]|nr:DUF393 domain-containing protein [Gammaproteobacteria bacterium]
MPSYPLTMLYDGDCALCSREVVLLKSRAKPERLRFQDIRAADFDRTGVGVSQQELLAALHVMSADGALLRGPEAMRAVYTAVGWDCLVRLSRLPLLSQLFDGGYWAFARWRPASRRCDSGSCSSG